MEIWHPTKETLFEFHIKQLYGPMAQKVSAHLEDCADCKTYVADFESISSLFFEQPKELPSDASLQIVRQMAQKAVKRSWWHSLSSNVALWKPAVGLSFVLALSVTSFFWISSGSDPVQNLPRSVAKKQNSSVPELGATFHENEAIKAGVNKAGEGAQVADSAQTKDASEVVLSDGIQFGQAKIASEPAELSVNKQVAQADTTTKSEPASMAINKKAYENGDVDELVKVAKKFELQNRFDKAEKVYARLVRENPHHPEKEAWKKSQLACRSKLQPKAKVPANARVKAKQSSKPSDPTVEVKKDSDDSSSEKYYNDFSPALRHRGD